MVKQEKPKEIKLDIDSMIEILHKNFGFKKVKDPFGNSTNLKNHN